ncbi:helix-turn-helix domain-containing protein [Pseudoclavibacter soli]|uniref:helix-turn-helix domain-containing protein n=1 Tax=Pseudoclavibacter soli TaxID=452623 RepID=UPI00041020CD|nr:helix-turn-helix domain-containing protein [Pseudoclavibacter soli]
MPETTLCHSTEQQQLLQARERYLDLGSVDRSSLTVTVAEAWRRCLPALPAITSADAPPLDLTPTDEFLASLVAPVLQALAERLNGLGAGLVVATDEGAIVSVRFADHTAQSALERIAMLPGHSYAERLVGPNGIGTALEQLRPALLTGAEHLNDAFADYTCFGMPLLHPFTGQLIGAVEATTRQPLQRAQLEVLQHTVLTAQRAIAQEFAQARRSGSLRAGSALPINPPTRRAHFGAQYRSFADVRLAEGASPMWRQTRNDLSGALLRHESVLAIGETGTGKTSAIDEIYQQTSPWGPSVVIEPGDVVGRLNRSRQLDPLLDDDPGLLIFRNIHALPQSAIRPLSEFLETRAAQVQLAATYNPAHMTDRTPAAWLLPAFQHTTNIPPLRARSDDIPGIVEQFLEVLANGRQPLRCSAEAMDVLSAGSWPGNLRQLHDVLAEIEANRGTRSMITLADIPQHANASALRELTMMQRIESDAIIKTLYEHGRNKSAAAQALGISRSSLYRKMSAYGITQL